MTLVVVFLALMALAFLYAHLAPQRPPTEEEITIIVRKWWWEERSVCPTCGLDKWGHLGIYGEHFENPDGVIVCPRWFRRLESIYRTHRNPFLDITNA